MHFVAILSNWALKWPGSELHKYQRSLNVSKANRVYTSNDKLLIIIDCSQCVTRPMCEWHSLEMKMCVKLDDVIKWRHSPRYWPFVRGIPRWIPLTKASDAELWCFFWSAPVVANNCCANNCGAGNSRRHRAHYDVTVMNVNHSLRWNELSTPWLIIFSSSLRDAVIFQRHNTITPLYDFIDK